MSTKPQINIGCSSFLGTVLTVIFVIAKIWGPLDWSWWWVFSPIWIPASIAAVLVLGTPVLGLIILGITIVVVWISDWINRK